MSRSASADAIFICLVAGIGFALIPSSSIGNIVQEREKGLKHMQVVSGLSLFAYWSANLVFDILKAFLPCVLVICTLFAFDMGYENCWATILLYPLGVIPFTYMASFFFADEATASTTMLFLNLVAGSIGGMAGFILRLIPDTMWYGDLTAMWLKVVPTYAISNSIIYDASKTTFNTSRIFA